MAASASSRGLVALVVTCALAGAMPARQDPSVSSMKKNRILVELSESPRTQHGKVAYEKQSKAQQVFSVIWELEANVKNGGFAQYFDNSSGDTAIDAEAALRTIGARRAADIVARAVALFPGGLPSRERGARQRRLATASPEVRSAWGRLDQQFFTYPDDLTSLLYAWVKAHPTEFGPVP